MNETLTSPATISNITVDVTTSSISVNSNTSSFNTYVTTEWVWTSNGTVTDTNGFEGYAKNSQVVFQYDTNPPTPFLLGDNKGNC